MKNKIIIISILILLGISGSYRLFRPGYPSMQDDMHVFRLQQYTQCINDFQIPCRHISEGGFGYGYPLFNFYSPLPYSLGHLFHSIGFSYLDSIKLVFVLTSFIRPIGIFLFSKLFFGSAGGLISAVIFSLAPYQALNSYVRGSIAENLALSLVPFIFWTIKSARYRLLSFFILLLSLSHNLTLLYTSPLILLFLIQQKKLKSGLPYLVLGYLMSSFFLLPAFFEKNYTNVKTMTQDYFDFHLHYTTLKQLFLSRFWGFGGSVWGEDDGMSFQVGYLQWIIPFLVMVLLLIKKQLISHKLIVFTFFLGLFSLFLTHNKSTFIWENLPFLAYYQFPWRFIGLATICFAFVSGSIVKFISPKVIYLIIPLALILNLNYFQEDIWYSSLTDSEKLSPQNIIAQSGAGLRDYWPNSGNLFPNEYASDPVFTLGTGKIISFQKNSLGISGQVEITSSKATTTMPLVYFPNFALIVDGQTHPFFVDNNLGLINIEFTQGTHSFSLNFTNTPLRTISNIISLLSFTLFLYLLRPKKNV